MELKDRVTELVDATTAGLKDDAELRLDVRAELLSHIRDKAEALRAGGKSEEESLELACKSFGPAADIAGALVEANRRRMKLRAVVRLAVRAAVVPASVVVALLICGSSVQRILEARRMTQFLIGPDAEPVAIYVPPGLPAEKAFLFTGDLSRETRPQQQRAIWEAHPENKVYYGNYITHLTDEARATAEPDLAFYEKEVMRGKALDPGNARYDYLLAGVLLEGATEEEWTRAEDGSHDMGLVVKDRAMLDRAMNEFLKGGSKPYLRTYLLERVEELLALLPEPRRQEDAMLRMAVAYGRPQPDLGLWRRLARAIPCYAELLAAEGRQAEAEDLLDSWLPFVEKIAADGLIFELLTAWGILGVVENDFASAYRKLGRSDKTEAAASQAQLLLAPIKAYSEARSWPSDPDIRLQRVQVAKRHGSSYGMIAFQTSQISEADLAPGRYMEHALLEQAALALIIALLLILMLGALVTALRWRFARGMSSAPLLLLPPWEETARILGLGVLLPLAAFYLYTRLSGIAGREYSLMYLLPRFVIELCLLTATISFLTVSMATAYVRRRCQTFGMPVPKAGRRRWLAHWIVLAILWAACLALREKEAAFWAAAIVGVPGSLFVLCCAVIAMIRRLRAAREYGLFHGTVARSLIPVFAAAAILIGAVANPYLTNLEAALVRRDPILTLDEELLINKPEADFVRKLKTEIGEAIDEIEAEKAGALTR